MPPAPLGALRHDCSPPLPPRDRALAMGGGSEGQRSWGGEPQEHRAAGETPPGDIWGRGQDGGAGGGTAASPRGFALRVHGGGFSRSYKNSIIPPPQLNETHSRCVFQPRPRGFEGATFEAGGGTDRGTRGVTGQRAGTGKTPSPPLRAFWALRTLRRRCRVPRWERMRGGSSPAPVSMAITAA